MKIPEIGSAWQVLLRPQKFGDYVNDHTVFKDKNGGWRLIGITGRGETNPCDERYFVNAHGVSLNEEMTEQCISINWGGCAWSPCVICNDGLYYMFYGPSPTKLAVSIDAKEWMGYEIKLHSNPPLSCHRDHFILKTGDNKWLMYVSGIMPDATGCISCLESDNLIDWYFKGYALKLSEKAELKPAWGALESPYVVMNDGKYYLFVTYTDCRDSNYNNTKVFCSDNPYDFGTYSEENNGKCITSLYAHAPEIICDCGKWYITTCGWHKKPNPNDGCVSIAELIWKDAK